MTKPAPLIFAHRGASADAPENTLAAFSLAAEAGADGVEFDVRIASDGVPVVFHDPDLKRIAGIRKKRVIQLTSSELAKIDAGSWFNRVRPQASNPAYTSERIPTLETTFRHLNNFPGELYIEIKTEPGKDTENENEDALRRAEVVAELAAASPLAPRVTVKSFSLPTMSHLVKNFPTLRTAVLFQPSWRRFLYSHRELIRWAVDAGVQEVSVHYSLAVHSLLDEAQKQNISVVIWTVDSPRWIKIAADYNIRGIITNRPAALIAARSELP